MSDRLRTHYSYREKRRKKYWAGRYTVNKINTLHNLTIKMSHHFVFQSITGPNSRYLGVTFRALYGQHYITTGVFSSEVAAVPRFRLKTKGDSAFEVWASKVWNSLPLDLRFVDTVDTLKRQLKTSL